MSGRYSEGAVCAAVDKIEDQRKPDDFIGHRKRAKPTIGILIVGVIGASYNFQLSIFNFQLK